MQAGCPYTRNNLINMNESHNRGIVYLAIGTEYQRYVVNSISCLRLTGYDGAIRIVSDISDWSETVTDCELILVDNVGEGFGSRYYKTQIYKYSYDFTLYLDADTIPIAPIEEIWNKLINSEMCMSLDLHPNVEHVIQNSVNDPERRRIEYDLMISSGLSQNPFYNSGVIAFRRCRIVENTFAEWHRQWKLFKHEDQLALVRAISRTGIQINTLSSIWNHRPRGISSLKEAQNSGIKILHFLSRQRPLMAQFDLPNSAAIM